MERIKPSKLRRGQTIWPTVKGLGFRKVHVCAPMVVVKITANSVTAKDEAGTVFELDVRSFNFER